MNKVRRYVADAVDSDKDGDFVYYEDYLKLVKIIKLQTQTLDRISGRIKLVEVIDKSGHGRARLWLEHTKQDAVEVLLLTNQLLEEV